MKVRAKRKEIITAVVIAAVMLTAVSLAAGAQSFGHMYDWARLNDEPHWRALLFPISVDGTILASTVVLYVDHRLDRPGTPLAYWLLGVGVAISVVANVFHTWREPDVAARGISAIGPLALFGIFHLFVQFIRSLAGVIPPKEPEPVVLEQDNPAEAAPADVVDQVAAEPDVVVATLRPARISAVRRPRRSGRLAGRRRGRKAPQAPAQPVLDGLPPGDGSTARQLYTAAFPDPGWSIVETAPERPGEAPDWRIETRQEPALQPPVDEAPQPVAASAADVKRPQTVTQPTRPRSRVARTSRKAKASPEDLQAAARAYWETEQAAGRNPSHRQIAAATGASKSSVSRWAPTWTTERQPS